MTVLLLAAPTLAAADDAKDPPRCTIVKVSGKATSIDVPNVYAKGQRWAEYNCRQDSRALATKWLTDNGGGACTEGHFAFKYSVTLGQKGSEKTIEMTLQCPKK